MRPACLFFLSFLVLFSLSAGAAERITYFVPDAQGSPVAAMDEQGNVLWRESYAPYGARKTNSPGNNAKPAYTGKPEDAGTGLVYMGARMYDPEAARFTGIDPQGFTEGNVQSFGRYVYANNSPYRYNDPSGETPSPVELLLTSYDAATFAWTLAYGTPMDVAEAGADLKDSLKGLAIPIPGAGVALKLKRAADAAEKASGDKKVYRVFGGDSTPDGASWTDVDPSTVPDFRQAAGLPSGGASGMTNSGRFVIEGTLVDPSAVLKTRDAFPLDGNEGGLSELVIPKAIERGAVRVDRVSGANPEF